MSVSCLKVRERERDQIQMVFLFFHLCFFLSRSFRRKNRGRRAGGEPQTLSLSPSLTLLNIIRQGERTSTHTHTRIFTLWTHCFCFCARQKKEKKKVSQTQRSTDKRWMDGWDPKKKRKGLELCLRPKFLEKKKKSEISNRKIKSGNEKDDHVPRSFLSLSLSLSTHTQSKKNPKRFRAPFFSNVSSWEVLASTPSLHYKSLTFHYHQM